MTTYQVFDSSQVEEWNSVLAEIGGTDIYYSPSYCKISENNGEGSAHLFVYREGADIVCYPYLMRRINDLPLPFTHNLNQDYYDIITPYGYGGPITNVVDEEHHLCLGESFGNTFGAYCQEAGIVAEFVRFHPILQNHALYKAVNPTNIRQTVCMDLSKDIIASLKDTCRNRVRYAIKHGLTVVKENPHQLEVFMDMYYETMNKNQANKYYYFPETYFHDSVNLLGEQNISLFSAKLEDQTIASALFIHSHDFVSYHLTGSDKSYLKYAPYNILLTEAAIWFQSLGYKYLHLGGGYRGNDELFRFKRTFTNDKPLEFYIGRKVHHPEIYESLSRGIQSQGDYFPIYRSYLLPTQEE
ncbi:MAG: GNAT family N-acetyltransferase [Gorillibacterium sp.]|nr:GNAT family N-acetyltransferase [Gorillibacterium sp.]